MPTHDCLCWTPSLEAHLQSFPRTSDVVLDKPVGSRASTGGRSHAANPLQHEPPEVVLSAALLGKHITIRGHPDLGRQRRVRDGSPACTR